MKFKGTGVLPVPFFFAKFLQHGLSRAAGIPVILPVSWIEHLYHMEKTTMHLKTIDLNSDVGESFGNYKLGLDEEVIPLISSANIACGYHAGDPAVMRKTVALALNHGVGLGAHPGLPDLVGFGRRNMDVTLEEIKDFVTVQIGALQAVAALQGARLQHVKPHGALYTMAVKNPAIWDAVAEVMAALDSAADPVCPGRIGPHGSGGIGRRRGIRVAFEFFADRAYNTDGSLVSRKLPGAVIHDNDVVAAKVLKLVKEGKVKTIDGSEIELKAETICVHGDNPKAVALVQKIRETLKAAGSSPGSEAAGRLLLSGKKDMVHALPRFRPMGDRSFLVELGDTISPDVNRCVQQLMLQLRQARLAGVRELAPGYRSLLVVFDPLRTAPAELKQRITEIAAQRGSGGLPKAKLITVPVFYGGDYGPDLEEVAAHLGISTDDVIRLHTETIYRVYMIGFTPGYPYMGELPAALAVPRRSTPRTRVPKGSVGIAQRQTGIYPVESPGGWQIIGWTPIELFDPARQQPSLLEMGDRVKFEAVQQVEI